MIILSLCLATAGGYAWQSKKLKLAAILFAASFALFVIAIIKLL
jgi:hypothetical protein